MDSSTQNQLPPLRVRDAKASVISKVIGGTAMIAIGATIAIESYWHMLNPEMLLVGGLVFVVGCYLAYKGSQEGIEKYHAMTRAFFPSN